MHKKTDLFYSKRSKEALERAKDENRLNEVLLEERVKAKSDRNCK